jgi:hypothetical protein
VDLGLHHDAHHGLLRSLYDDGANRSSLNGHCSSAAMQYRTCSMRREFPTRGRKSWRQIPMCKARLRSTR